MTIRFATPALMAGSNSIPAKADIVDTAIAAGSFKTHVAALKAAGLTETLKDSGPFTVRTKSLQNCPPARLAPF